MSGGRNITAAGRRRRRRRRAAGRARARSRVFGLLARALRHPDADLFAALHSGYWAAEFAAAVRQSGIRRQESVLAELRRLPQTVPAELAELQALHTTLFSSGNVCPHQESDYAASHVFQKADLMADVAGFYAAFGLRVSTAHRELPDFLGAELEFLYLAGSLEAQARRHGHFAAASVCREAQEKFLAEHLGGWLSRFREKMECSAAGPFYVLLARLTEGFVKAQEIRPGSVPVPRFIPPAEVSQQPACAESCAGCG